LLDKSLVRVTVKRLDKTWRGASSAGRGGERAETNRRPIESTESAPEGGSLGKRIERSRSFARHPWHATFLVRDGPRAVSKSHPGHSTGAIGRSDHRKSDNHRRSYGLENL